MIYFDLQYSNPVQRELDLVARWKYRHERTGSVGGRWDHYLGAIYGWCHEDNWSGIHHIQGNNIRTLWMDLWEWDYNPGKICCFFLQ